MRLVAKYLILLLSITAISGCQSEEPDPDLNFNVNAGAAHQAYSPGAATFTLTAAANTVVAGNDLVLTLTAVDSNNEPYSASVSSIAFSYSGGTSTGSFNGISPKGNGVFEAKFTGNLAGTATTIRAKVNGYDIASTVNVTVTVGSPKSIIIMTGDNQAAQVRSPTESHAVPVNPVLKVADKYGNPIPGYTIDLNISNTTPGNSTINDASTTTLSIVSDTNGLIEVSWVMGNQTGVTNLIATDPAGTVTTTTTMIATAYDVPATPELYVTGVSGRVDLAWTITSTGGSAAKFFIYRGTTPAVLASNIASNSALSGNISDFYFSDTSASNGTYYYAVIANNGFINSLQSNTVNNAITVSNTWTMLTANASEYTYNSSLINFNNDVCSLTPSLQTDDSTFGLSSGTGVGASYDGSSMVRLDTTGTITNNSALDLTWVTKWSNLVSYWKLDEASGAFADSKGSNTGTGMGTVGYATTAKMNKGVTFNGTNTFVKMASNATFNSLTSTISVSAWVKTTSAATMIVFSTYSGGTGGFQMYMSAGKMAMLSSGAGVVGTSLINDGFWHHLVGTWSSGVYNMYIDGRLEQAGSLTALASNKDAQIGVSCSGAGSTTCTSYFNGVIDDVSLWNTTLSLADIQNLYDRQSARISGVYYSRVMNGQYSTANWSNFYWTTNLPFFKALPDASNGSAQSETSTEYAQQSSGLMQGNIGLWHFDEIVGTNFVDTSTVASSYTIPAGTVASTSGRFGSALDLNGSTYMRVPYSSTTRNLTTSWTVQAWVKAKATGTGYTSIVGDEYNASMARIQFNLGYHADGKIHANAYNGTWYNTTPAYTLQNGTWTHLVGVYSGAAGSITLYANGVQVASVTGVPSTMQTIGLATRIGRAWHTSYTDSFKGAIDEVALWNRALSASEVAQLYRRGGNRIKFQVRTCTTAGCVDDPTGIKWKGPSGSNASYFSEFHNKTTQAISPTGGQKLTKPTIAFNNFLPPSPSPSPAPPNQYFQYRAVLESDDDTSTSNICGATWCSPELLTAKVDPLHYTNSSPTVYTNNSVPFARVLKMTETTACSGIVTYNFSIDKVDWYYWTGVAWVKNVSGSVNSSNPLSAVTAVGVISTFERTVGTGPVYVKAFLRSNGTSTCSLTSFKLEGQ